MNRKKWEVEALRLSLEEKENPMQDFLNKKKTPSPGVSTHGKIMTLAPPDSSMWRKDFKIAGQIGEPGQKDKLTFSSLAR